MRRPCGVLPWMGLWGLLAGVGIAGQIAADGTRDSAVNGPRTDAVASVGENAPTQESAGPAVDQSGVSRSASAAGGTSLHEGDHSTLPSPGREGAAHRDSSAAGGADHAASHAGPPHDPYDLTHANASDKLGDITEVRYDHMLGSWLVFLLLVVGVGKLAWKPIIQALEKREQAIAAKIEEAEVKAQAAAERLREYEARLAQAAEEGRALIAKAQQEAERRSAEILAAAEQAAVRERTRAMAEIEAARVAALEQLAQHSADLAVLMASRVLHRQLTSDDHRQLIGEALRQFSPHHH